MEKNKCLKCGHEWIARVDKPLECPGCQSNKWNSTTEVDQNGKGEKIYNNIR